MEIFTSRRGKVASFFSDKHVDEEEGSCTENVDLLISSQIEAGKRKLAFLSDEKYLTFLGRLPYEGGKLTKIVVLSRDAEARSKLESVTRSLGLPRFPDFETMESRAKHVSGMSIKVSDVSSEILLKYWYSVRFINETKFPMKVVCASTTNCSSNVELTTVLEPRGWCHEEIPSAYTITVNGYILLYLDGKKRSDDYPRSPDKTRVIEFALSWPYSINIQDKTGSEFTKGEDTFDKMQNGEDRKKTIYWLTNGTHHMARGEILPFKPLIARWHFKRTLWRYIMKVDLGENVRPIVSLFFYNVLEVTYNTQLQIHTHI